MTFKQIHLLPRIFFLTAIFIAWYGKGYAQNGKPEFQDSIQFVLENTKMAEPIAVGTAFGARWNGLSSEQQNTIKKQVWALRKKGFHFVHFIHYYSCINAAESHLDSFLETASLMIAKENMKAIQLFFLNSRIFLEKHALNFTVPFKVLADAPFTFAYVPRKIISDTVAVDYSADSLANNLEAAPKIPAHEGALLRFDSPVSLQFVTVRDTTILKDTKGTFSLVNKSFHGSGGRFDWSAAGDTSNTYYVFKEFAYHTTSPFLSARGGTLFTEKSAIPIAGIFEFKALPSTAEAGSYPRFTSYKNNLQISGLPQAVQYSGGFALRGNHIKNYSVKGGLSRLAWSESDGRKLVAYGKTFHLNQTKGIIEGEDIGVTIYHDHDSITHPSRSFKFDYNNHKLLLLPAQSSMKNAPFLTSMFGLDFNADELSWDANTDRIKLSIRGSGRVSPMVFESSQYYSPDDFRILQGHGFRFHPLLLATRYAKTTGQRKFYVSELIPGSGSNYETVQMAMGMLAEKGMILFNPYTSQITVREKAMLWMEAYNKKTDYDNLKIQSYYDSGANAVIDLKDKIITVRGVDDFIVSDSLDVRIHSDSSILRITPNRGFTYNGVLRSGIFEIHGKNFAFDYGLYAFNMQAIDSIRLHTKREGGGHERVNNSLISLGNNLVGNNPEAIKNALANVSKFTSGTIYINRPDNKAGLKKFPNYPRLESKGSEIIYFDQPRVLNGAYDRSVYFFVPPFAMDSLGKSDSEDARFNGKFMTSGMLPDFDEELYTMPDRTLGFLHPIPASGYKLYDGNGLLFGNLSFNSKGLRNNGKLQFLTTTLYSKDFILYPDSVTTLGSSGEVKEGVVNGTPFPNITFKEYRLKWLPKEDKMHIFNTTAPFELYKGLATLHGGITVSEKMVKGKGRMKLPGSEVASKSIEFFTKKINAQDARFKVFTENSKIPAMDGKHVALEFDLNPENARIRPEVVGQRAFEFPLMRFKTSISTAAWDLKTQKITMKAEGDIANSTFVSTKPELDSLRFNAEQAEYDIATETLTLTGVPYITVADMRITPENRTFVVKKNAQFGVFKNATIVADTAHQYHKLSNGQVEIISRNKLKGSATYRYGNILGDTFNIKMSAFEAVALDSGGRKAGKKPRMQTSAKGEIPDSINLRMSPRMLFKGTAVMYAAYPKLNLQGFVCPEIKSETKKTWIKYNQTGKEVSQRIPFDKAVSEEGETPLAGLYFDQKGSPYPLFIAEKKDPADLSFFKPSGVLYFDEKSSLFKIEDTLKASGKNLSGQLFSYNDSTLNSTFDGKLEFVPDFLNLKFMAAGIGKYTHSIHEITLNGLLMLDGKLNSTALQLMADRLKQVAKEINANSGHGDHTQLLYKMGAMLPEKVIQEFEKNSLQTDIPLFSVPLFLKSLVISNFDMLYSDKHKAFYSTGMIGVSNIGKTNIDAEFEGYIEVRRVDPLNPELNIFIKAAGDAWYYLGLIENRLTLYSSDAAFNSAVGKKPNTPKIGEVAFLSGTEGDVEDFITRFRKDYSGIERAYNLADDMADLKSLLKKDEPDANLSGQPEKEVKPRKQSREKKEVRKKEVQEKKAQEKEVLEKEVQEKEVQEKEVQEKEVQENEQPLAEEQPETPKEKKAKEKKAKKEKKEKEKKDKKKSDQPAEDKVLEKPVPGDSIKTDIQTDSIKTKPAKKEKVQKKEDDGF